MQVTLNDGDLIQQMFDTFARHSAGAARHTDDAIPFGKQ
jgi:hypothetical protein